MRITKQKQLVYEIIYLSDKHPTAMMVYEKALLKMPHISLGTVYRNINMLVDEGKIIRIKMPDGIDRFDKCLSHAHFICNNCSKVIDVYNYKLSYDLDNLTVSDYSVKFFGYCSDCEKRGR